MAITSGKNAISIEMVKLRSHKVVSPQLALGKTSITIAQSQQLAQQNYQLVTYDSQVLNSTRTYGISLPAGYAQHPNRHYPVIFLLHGGHGDPTSWFEEGSAMTVSQQLYAAGRLPPSIIIAPDGYDWRGSSPFYDPQYTDRPNSKMNTAIGEELVKLVQSRYRTLPAPDFWAIGGLSSGGWGALNIGLHHPAHFSTLFSHSGYFRDPSGSENSPVQYIQTLPKIVRQQLHIYLDAGSGPGDSRFLAQSQEFHQVLDQLGVANVFNAFPGGHGDGGPEWGWNYWHKHLADSLAFVGARWQSSQTDVAARSWPGSSALASGSEFHFPQDSCGDHSTDAGAWYRVLVKDENLSYIRSHYCRDAFLIFRQESGQLAIQVASFNNYAKASKFAKAVKGEVESSPSAFSKTQP